MTIDREATMSILAVLNLALAALALNHKEYSWALFNFGIFLFCLVSR